MPQCATRGPPEDVVCVYVSALSFRNPASVPFGWTEGSVGAELGQQPRQPASSPPSRRSSGRLPRPRWPKLPLAWLSLRAMLRSYFSVANRRLARFDWFTWWFAWGSGGSGIDLCLQYGSDFIVGGIAKRLLTALDVLEQLVINNGQRTHRPQKSGLGEGS